MFCCICITTTAALCILSGMQMLIASRLADGQVVFLADGHDWTESIDQGAVAESAEAGASLLAVAAQAVQQSAVVDPYLIDVIEHHGGRRPVVLREAIRAFGPTVATDVAHARR